jgi:hypothetical protein
MRPTSYILCTTWEKPELPLLKFYLYSEDYPTWETIVILTKEANLVFQAFASFLNPLTSPLLCFLNTRWPNFHAMALHREAILDLRPYFNQRSGDLRSMPLQIAPIIYQYWASNTGHQPMNKSDFGQLSKGWIRSVFLQAAAQAECFCSERRAGLIFFLCLGAE